jgi:hypothetical protein
MREIDFLPAWYPAIQRRYRWVIAQAWGTLIILLLLTAYAAVQRWNVRLASQTTAQAEAQITVSRQQLAQLTEKLNYEDELRRQEQIVSRVGIGVETTRLLKALEDAMTPDMALTNLTLETVDQARPTQTVLRLNTSPVSDPSPQVDRVLKVKVDGVAPTDLEVALLMQHLQQAGCFENVAPPYMREGRSRNGHAMREFEITFDINLNAQVEDSR